MADESTPLIQTVQVGPQPRRYPHQTCRRFFTIACSCLLIGGFAAFAISFFVLDNHHHHFFRHGHRGHHSVSAEKSKWLSYDELKAILTDTPSAERAEEWSRYYTSGAHYAGTNFSQVSRKAAAVCASQSLTITARPNGLGKSGSHGASSPILLHTRYIKTSHLITA